MALLDIANLTVELAGHPVVDDLSLSLAAGRLQALVGESGSGKTMTADAVLRLLPPAARVTRGRAMLGALDLLAASPRELAKVRGRRVTMVLQEPLAALSPVMRVGAQIAEALEVHRGLGRAAARARAVELLREVGLADPELRVDAYPHQLSGGMRQRALLAASLACDPEVLIADEPTTALDATLQGLVLALLRALARDRGLAVLLITHDLSLVNGTCDEVAVMYAGRIVEQGPVAAVFAAPRHPYTAGLLRSRPALAARDTPLAAVDGAVPSPAQRFPGCRFRPRCPRALQRCAAEVPALDAALGAACFNPEPR